LGVMPMGVKSLVSSSIKSNYKSCKGFSASLFSLSSDIVC
jgi:hypothetical protein